MRSTRRLVILAVAVVVAALIVLGIGVRGHDWLLTLVLLAIETVITSSLIAGLDD